MPDKRSVILFTNPASIDGRQTRGPGVVTLNLLMGLQQMGIEVKLHPRKWHPGEQVPVNTYVGCLQPVAGFENLPRNTLMGPNLFVLPREFVLGGMNMCSAWDHYLVPSKWVQDKYGSFRELVHATLDIWPVGVDTETWKPKQENQPKEYDCFIYFKNRSKLDLSVVKVLLNKFALKHIVLSYGEYREEDLKTLCEKSRFAVLLTGTESQGLGYMQMMSMNLPCYVFDKPFWNYEGTIETKYPGTSVPYFDNRCGEKTTEISRDHFEQFLEKVSAGKFSPRDYILENHTLRMGAEKYYQLLEKYQGTK